jgi:8-oxo-dGTP diphosphatase
MQYNVIVVFDENKTRVLMCRRRKDPYKGLLNLVGGKIEKDEDHIDAAYRELWEETAITKKQIHLIHVMDFTYVLEDGFLEVYAGTLYRDVLVSGTENKLIWVDVNEDFSDTSRFAGYGNIYHMMNYIKAFAPQIEAEEKLQPK